MSCPTTNSDCVAQSWCPSAAALSCTSDTSCTPSATLSCVTWVNATTNPSQTLNFVGDISGTPMCFTVAPNCSWTVQVLLPASWTVTGETSGTELLVDFLTNVSGTYTVTSLLPSVPYSEHRTIPWLPLAIGSGVASIGVAAYGILVNRSAVRRVCEANPNACALNIVRDPQTGVPRIRGKPTGFKSNLWLLPALLLALLAIALVVGYAASRGAFGYSTLSYESCLARSNGWFFTSLYNQPMSRFIAQFLGLGRCANNTAETNCIIMAQQNPNTGFHYDIAVAQSSDPNVYGCACITSTGQGYNCNGGGGNQECSICQAGV